MSAVVRQTEEQALVMMRLNEAGLHVIEFGRWTPLARRCPYG
jgi:hypothetical protein